MDAQAAAGPSATEALRPLQNTAIAFIVLNTVFLVLRFFTVLKLRSRRLALTWDDWFLIPAYLCCISIAICALCMVHFESVDNPPADELIMDPIKLKPVLQSLFALLELLAPAYAFTRYSVLALYLRIFSGRIVRTISYVMIALLSAQWIAFAISTAMQCNPTAYYWDRTIAGGHCPVDVNQFNRSFTPVNVAFDIVILALPLPTIWGLNASRTRKAGITFIFSLGLLALAASLARLITLEKTPTDVISPEYSEMLIPWLVVEPGLYFITACLPAMQPLFRALVPPAIRHHVNGQIDMARDKHAGSPSNHRRSMLGGVNVSAPFERLADPTDRTMSLGMTTAEARARSNNPLTLGRGKKADQIMLQEMERGGEGVAMEDLKQVTTGGGIMVQTEISVTQEQKIEEVLDF